MDPRDQLHQLVDDLIDEATRARLHASVDSLPETELSDALNRMLTLRRLAPEQFRSAPGDSDRGYGRPTFDNPIDTRHDSPEPGVDWDTRAPDDRRLA